VRKLAGALLAGLVACSPSPTSAEAVTPLKADAPRLIVAISVDQFSADLFDEYRGQFTGGLKRLASGGAVFRNGYQSHNATETCPGHSTIMTGARPSRTGIIANIWFDPSQARSDKAVYCAEDERVPGSSSSAYTVSPFHLKVPTLGDRLKAAQSASRNVAVAGKDRSAVMMSGHRADQRWYWDGKKFATDLKGSAVPRSVASANQAVAAMIAAPSPPLEAPALCQAKSRVIPLTGGGAPVGGGRLARSAGDTSGFRANPAFDGATLALAAALVGELQLGKGGATDVLSVGLAATDYVGHKYGTRGAEMCLQLLSLDRDVGDFLAFLDRSGLDYAVVLTADHGGEDVPERLREQGVPEAVRVDPALNASAMGKSVAAKVGLSGQVLYGDSAFGDMYLDRKLTPAQQARVLAEAVAAYRAHPQVEAVFTKDQLKRAQLPTSSPDKWSLIEKARASFDAQRSGDFVVLLRRHVTPIADTKVYAATHGSPWDYDRRVPILFWRKGMPAAAYDTPIETVDIMPTLAAMIGLAILPGSVDGRCLVGAAVACPR
jgi:predicted AlkP superfamily pyrophosphatase or phosphodiesterase